MIYYEYDYAIDPNYPTMSAIDGSHLGSDYLTEVCFDLLIALKIITLRFNYITVTRSNSNVITARFNYITFTGLSSPNY